jgi:hypothetical protein
MDEAETSTRRTWLRRGLKLAVAGPFVVAGLQASSVSANDDDDDAWRRSLSDDIRDRVRRALADIDINDDETSLVRIGVSLHHFSAGLCRVSDANGFNADNTGSDPLTSGRLRLVGRTNDGDDDKIAVVLRGAQPDASYDVVFVPDSGNRESLGNVGPTNGRGSLVALTPNALSGARRVGSFVLRRDGRDQFVSCLGD